ncbi:unnamed protein product [Sphagnum tenellum]
MMRESPVKEKKKTRTETVHETGHGVTVTRYVPTSGGGANLERLRYVSTRGEGANLESVPTRYELTRGGGANLESLPTRYVSTGGNTVVTSYHNVDWLECLLTPMLIPLPSDFVVET